MVSLIPRTTRASSSSSSSSTISNREMNSLTGERFPTELESDSKFQDSSAPNRAGSFVRIHGSRCTSPSSQPTDYKQPLSHGRRYGRRFRPSLVSLWVYVYGMIVFLGVVSTTTHHHPLIFAEARLPTPTRPITTVSNRMKPKSQLLASTTTTATATANENPHPLYAWGNLGHTPQRISLAKQIETKTRNLVESCATRLANECESFVASLTMSKCFGFALGTARRWVFWYFSKDCMKSLVEDRWFAERDPDKFFGDQGGGMWITKGGHKEVVKRRMKRSKRNRQWVGLGYTPR